MMCTCRYGGRSRSDGHAGWKCPESYAKREGDGASRGMCQHKDSHRFRYEATLGASSAVVPILDNNVRKYMTVWNVTVSSLSRKMCKISLGVHYILASIFPYNIIGKREKPLIEYIFIHINY